MAQHWLPECQRGQSPETSSKAARPATAHLQDQVNRKGAMRKMLDVLTDGRSPFSHTGWRVASDTSSSLDDDEVRPEFTTLSTDC